MANPTKDHSQMDLVTYDVLWKTNTIGYCQDVDPTPSEAVVKEKIVGNIPGIILDRVHVGPNATITMMLQQPNIDVLRYLAPWALATGSFSAFPEAAYFSEYANSGILILHPSQLAGGTTTDDIYAPKAFPIFKLPKSNALQPEWRVIPVTFRCYIDQSALPLRKALYYGGAPQ